MPPPPPRYIREETLSIVSPRTQQNTTDIGWGWFSAISVVVKVNHRSFRRRKITPIGILQPTDRCNKDQLHNYDCYYMTTTVTRHHNIDCTSRPASIIPNRRRHRASFRRSRRRRANCAINQQYRLSDAVQIRNHDNCYLLTSRPCTVLDWWTNFHRCYCKHLCVKLYFNLAHSLYAMHSVMAH